MTAAALNLLILAAFVAGVTIGAFWRWICGLADEADEFDGIEHPPVPRVSTQIFDGYHGKEIR